MEEEHPAVTNEVKTAMFYGWKYRHCFVVAVAVNFAKALHTITSFCNSPDIYM